MRPRHAEDAYPVSPADLLAEIAVIQQELGAVPGRAVPMFAPVRQGPMVLR
ncbi:MAG: hypothetical protein NDJ94_17175 [Vicinamibacteria bacterium]|jgi:hypothetical protein|nr:hypothetical protein [Vicinamibacteria bacterium]